MTTNSPRVLCASCGQAAAEVIDDATRQPLCARCWLDLEETTR